MQNQKKKITKTKELRLGTGNFFYSVSAFLHVAKAEKGLVEIDYEYVRRMEYIAKHAYKGIKFFERWQHDELISKRMTEAAARYDARRAARRAKKATKGAAR